jgi:hypothetical protein
VNAHECINCLFLGRCDETSEQRLLEHYFCPRWEAEIYEVAEARRAVIRQVGSDILHVLVHPPKEG